MADRERGLRKLEAQRARTEMFEALAASIPQWLRDAAEGVGPALRGEPEPDRMYDDVDGGINLIWNLDNGAILWFTFTSTMLKMTCNALLDGATREHLWGTDAGNADGCRDEAVGHVVDYLGALQIQGM